MAGQVAHSILSNTEFVLAARAFVIDHPGPLTSTKVSSRPYHCCGQTVKYIRTI